MWFCSTLLLLRTDGGSEDSCWSATCSWIIFYSDIHSVNSSLTNLLLIFNFRHILLTLKTGIFFLEFFYFTYRKITFSFIFTNSLRVCNCQHLSFSFLFKSLPYSHFGKLFGLIFQSFTCVVLLSNISILIYIDNINGKVTFIVTLFQLVPNWKLCCHQLILKWKKKKALWYSHTIITVMRYKDLESHA